MTPRALREELEFLTDKAIEAQPLIPRNSFYLVWTRQLIDRSLPAHRYPRLRKRLTEFYKKNANVGQ